jgi:hypothetical protein
MKKIFLSSLFLLLFAQSPAFCQTYEKWLSRCQSYKDVALWLNQNFFYDREAIRKALYGSQKEGMAQNIQVTKETFRRKTGLSLEAALFAKHSLNQINPDYHADIIYLYAGKQSVHFVCGFYIGGKLYVMDYGTPYEKLMGTNGPFSDLDEYVKKFYLKNHPKLRKLQSYAFGQPSKFH